MPEPTPARAPTTSGRLLQPAGRIPACKVAVPSRIRPTTIAREAMKIVTLKGKGACGRSSAKKRLYGALTAESATAT